MKAEPFLLTPAGKDYLWGGSRLKWDFAKDTVSGNMTLYAKWTTEAPAPHFSLWWLILLILLLIVILLILWGRKNGYRRGGSAANNRKDGTGDIPASDIKKEERDE